MRKNLLLVPGLLCTAELWTAQIAALEDIADAIVADNTSADSIQAMAATILKTAPDRFALASLSMGGFIALEIMRQAPDRVTHLGLFNTNARADLPDQIKQRQGFISVAKRGRFLGVSPQLLPSLIHPDQLDNKYITGTIIRMAKDTGPDAFIRQEQAIMGRMDSRPSLAAISCPTLIIAGDSDQRSPVKLHQEMADAIPHARLEILERCGHLAPLEKPEIVNTLMREWLTEVTA